MSSVTIGLYYTSSLLYFLILPKHIRTGISKVRPAVSTVHDNPSFALPKAIIPPTWDYVVGSILIFGKLCRMCSISHRKVFLHCSTGILNYQWAQTGGPVTTAESLVMLINGVCSVWTGFGYYRARLYVALGVLWVVPVFNLVAFLL